MHNIFKWLEDHPEDRDRAYNDKVFLQRATHETIRLQPSSPTAARWALEHLELKSGIKISEGDKVIIDLEPVNRSQDLYGDDASEFNPTRELQNGVTPWGLSFGQGMHACIGQDLAAGLVFDTNSTEEDHLFGLVPVAVQTLFCLMDTRKLQSFRGKDTRGEYHWWLVDIETDKIFDPTVAQYDELGIQPPYADGKKCSWYGFRPFIQKRSMDVIHQLQPSSKFHKVTDLSELKNL